jgi:hypothetical protein
MPLMMSLREKGDLALREPRTLSLLDLRSALASCLGVELDPAAAGQSDGAVMSRIVSRSGLQRTIDAVAAQSISKLAAVCELACLAGEAMTVLLSADAMADEAEKLVLSDVSELSNAIQCVWRASRALAMTGMPHRAVQLLGVIGSRVWEASGSSSGSAGIGPGGDSVMEVLGSVLGSCGILVEQGGAGRACQRCSASIPPRAIFEAVYSPKRNEPTALGPSFEPRRHSDPAASVRQGTHSIACPSCGHQTVPRLAARLPSSAGVVSSAGSEPEWAELLSPSTLSSELCRVASMHGPEALHLANLQANHPRLFLSFAFCVGSLLPTAMRGSSSCDFLTDSPSDAWLTSTQELDSLVHEDGGAVSSDAPSSPVLLLPGHAQSMLHQALSAAQWDSVAPSALADSTAAAQDTALDITAQQASTDALMVVDHAHRSKQTLAGTASALKALKGELAALRALTSTQATQATELLRSHTLAVRSATEARLHQYREDALASKAALLRALGRVRVLVRVRPARVGAHAGATWDAASGSAGCLEWAPDGAGLHAISASVAVSSGESLRRETAVTDRVFSPSTLQGDVWDEVCPVVMHCLQGGAGSVLAYGQTGSGKTHTMGLSSDMMVATTAAQTEGGHAAQEAMKDAGVVPRALAMLLSASSVRSGSLVPTLACVELHNNRVVDLLPVQQPQQQLQASASAAAPEPPKISVHVQTSGKRVVRLGNVMQRVVSSVEEGMGLLARASTRRATSSTKMNETSSRSHCMVVLRLYPRMALGDDGPDFSRSQPVGKLILADLAGSERVKRAGTADSAGGASLRESSSINSSLSALGNMVNALAKNSSAAGGGTDSGGHVPWRESLLTRLLADCIGGDAATVLIATVAPDEADGPETARTLQIADRAMHVKSAMGASGGGAVLAERRAAKLEQDLAASKATVQKLRQQLEAAKASSRTTGTMPRRAARSRAGSLRLGSDGNDGLAAASSSGRVLSPPLIRTGPFRTPQTSTCKEAGSVSPMRRIHAALDDARGRDRSESGFDEAGPLSPAAQLASRLANSLSSGADASPGTMLYALARLATGATADAAKTFAPDAAAPPMPPPLSLSRAPCTPLRAGCRGGAPLVRSPRSNARSAATRRTPQSHKRGRGGERGGGERGAGAQLYTADGHRIKATAATTPQQAGFRV